MNTLADSYRCWFCGKRWARYGMDTRSDAEGFCSMFTGKPCGIERQFFGVKTGVSDTTADTGGEA